MAKKDSEKQNISQDGKVSAEEYSLGISRDSGKGLDENKISTLEFQKTPELNGSNDNGIIHFESKFNGTNGDSCNMISTFEFSHTTEKSNSNGMLIVDDIRATDVPTNSLHPTDGTDMQGILVLDDTRNADLPSNTISPLQLQEIFTSEDSYSSLSPQETYTSKNSDSSLLVQESLSLKDPIPSSFHEPHIPKDPNTTLPFQELHVSGDSNLTLELQKPFESNDSNCTSPLPVQESELLISSPDIDSSLSLQNNLSSPPPNHDLQAFCQSENENMSVRNQHQVVSESPPTTLFESCSRPLNDEKLLTLESSSFLKDSSTLLVSSQNQILTKSSTALGENNSSPLPTQNDNSSPLPTQNDEDASTHPSSRGSNSIDPTNGLTNGYSVLGKYSDEDFMEEVSLSLSRRQTSSFRNEDLSIYFENETLKLELEMKDDKIAVLTRELSDMSFTGKAEEEVAVLKKAKHDLELKVKDQLEDAEFAKNAAIKARQSAESDFSELQNQLEEALRAKKDTEDKLARVTKEKSEVQTQYKNI
ncbi:hypothetical protein Anas_01118, partial [Armadillidium nasatum]